MDLKKIFTLIFLLCVTAAFADDNQTDELTPILSDEALPFRIRIEQADFSLPNGIHSYASARYNGKLLLIAGRTNGMHTFNNDNNNFPPQAQNTVVYVIDLRRKTVFFRSLYDESSGLSQEQIDTLSVTSPQFYQTKKRLYITGGYGVDTATGLFSTKDTLSIIDIPGLIEWVENGPSSRQAVKSIRQTNNPLFKVTGGYMTRINKKLWLLVFGQNFQGFYVPESNGQYTEQVRRFSIKDNGRDIAVEERRAIPEVRNPNFRRRDLNVVPVFDGKTSPSFVAFSGVFTPAGGIWTVPVWITNNGVPFMQNPDDPAVFKQGMNNYTCATVGFYSGKHKKMYVVFLGGISFGYFQDGNFQTDTEIPFINQLTTVRIDKKGNYTQYLMDSQYPEIISTASNPGNPLLFGAAARFFPLEGVPEYDNRVIRYDYLRKGPVLLGYIVGGIQSTLPNTNVASDSAASPYIFEVYLDKL